MVNELEAGFRTEVGDLLENYDDATTNEGELQRLKDYYLKKRYLLRLKNRNPEV
jgi:molecular chaperone HscB